MSDEARAEWIDLAAHLLWPFKMLGIWATVMLWPAAGIVGFGGSLDEDAHWSQPLFLSLFVAWPVFYLGVLLPGYRWLRSAAVSARLGEDPPRWRFGTGGSLVHQAYEGANRQILALADTGVLVHPSEDGLNGLGDSGGLSRTTIDRFGYQQVAVGPWWTRPHCHTCQTLLSGAERCGQCGTHVQSSGAPEPARA